MNAEQISNMLFRIANIAVEDRNDVVIIVLLQRWIPADVDCLCLLAIIVLKVRLLKSSGYFSPAKVSIDSWPLYSLYFCFILVPNRFMKLASWASWSLLQPDCANLLLWSSLLLSSLLDDCDKDEELVLEPLCLFLLTVLLVATSEAEFDDFPLWTVRYTMTPAAITKTQATMIRQFFLLYSFYLLVSSSACLFNFLEICFICALLYSKPCEIWSTSFL